MASKLNERDLELIQTNKTMQLNSARYNYIGGEFTKNSRDYVEVLIYDVNENLVESGIVDSTDYSYDTDTGVKLKTGTILRKMGYDRGRFIVKYNFLRKVAGSYETVLVDTAGNIWNGAYHQMDSGRIMTGDEHTASSEPLYLKDYSYFVHEISDSRSEVRLVPQLINNSQYKDDFFNAQKQEKNVGLVETTLRFISDANTTAGNSLTLETEKTGVFTPNMKSGVIVLNNAFISHIIPDPARLWGNAPTDEFESDTIQARFIVSADIGSGNTEYVSGDRNFSTLYEIMKDVSANTTSRANLSGIIAKETNVYSGLRGIQQLKNMYQLIYKQSDPDLNPTIFLKSVSSKPDISTTYTWEITGWDYDSDGYEDGETKPAIAADNYTNGDVEIIKPSPNPQSLLKVVDANKLNGSEIGFKIHSSNIHIGIKLTIKPKDAAANTIWLPACIVTTN